MTQVFTATKYFSSLVFDLGGHPVRMAGLVLGFSGGATLLPVFS